MEGGGWRVEDETGNVRITSERETLQLENILISNRTSRSVKREKIIISNIS